MGASRSLFAVFLGVVALVLFGLVVLPSAGTNGPMAGLWLTWLFGLWGALVLGVIFLIAWVAEASTE